MNFPVLRSWMTGLRTGCVVLLAGVLLAGCATGPDAHPRDPLEPWNRRVYRFNDAVDKAVVKPVTVAYTKVTPQFMQKGVRNFFSNLGDAWSTVNSILQFKGKAAVDNFFRFAVNTVFGFGGVLDIASEARIPQVKQDFGLTLGSWGMPSGPYIVLPFFGPSSLRDTAALPVDIYGNPVRYIRPVSARNALTGLSWINRRAQLLAASDLLDQAALDPYAFMRDAYLQQRDARTGQTARYTASGAADAANDGYEPPLDADGAATPADSMSKAGTANATDGAQPVTTEGYEPPLPRDDAHELAPASALEEPSASAQIPVLEQTPVAVPAAAAASSVAGAAAVSDAEAIGRTPAHAASAPLE